MKTTIALLLLSFTTYATPPDHAPAWGHDKDKGEEHDNGGGNDDDTAPIPYAGWALIGAVAFGFVIIRKQQLNK